MRSLLRILLTLAFFVFLSLFYPTGAQEPPPPPANGHGMQGNQSPGGGAKIGDGVAILVAFALAYGYRRIRQKRKILAEKPSEEDA